MRFFTSILAGAAVVAGVLAQKPTIDTVLDKVEAGESLEIEYRPADATAKIVLRQGNPGDLDTLETITETATGGKFTWNVPATITNGEGYALQIIVDGEDNYSTRFEVSGGSEEPVSSAASSEPATTVVSTETETVSGTATVTVETTAESTGTPSLTTSVRSTASETTEETGTPSPTEDPEEPSNTGSGPPESTGAASTLGSSPLALVFGAVAAMAYLN